ncbi:MAG: hypothetical protein U5K84_10765 [Alkalibacterium sp.]|nr:hypothetical protein [Alkalibacterium sp.]
MLETFSTVALDHFDRVFEIHQCLVQGQTDLMDLVAFWIECIRFF